MDGWRETLRGRFRKAAWVEGRTAAARASRAQERSVLTNVQGIANDYHSIVAQSAGDERVSELLNRASGVSNLPFQTYGGEFVAPINQQQQAAIGSINQSAGLAQPYL